MKKLFLGMVALAALVLVAGCGGGAGPRSMVKADQVSTVAIVSMGVNNYGQFGSRG